MEGVIISESKDICVSINLILKLAGLSRINKKIEPMFNHLKNGVFVMVI